MPKLTINWGSQGVTDSYTSTDYVSLRTKTSCTINRRYQGACRAIRFYATDILPNGGNIKKITINASYCTNSTGSGSDFRIAKYTSVTDTAVKEYLHKYSNTTNVVTIKEEDDASLYEISEGRYGISFWLYNSTDFGRTLYLSDVSLEIEYESSSQIFNGSSNITSAYLGNTKLNGIYLGSQKLL